MWREYRTEIIALLCVIVLIPAAFAVGRMIDRGLLSGAHPLEDYNERDPCPSDASLTSTCWIAYYEAFVEKYPAVEALADLKTRYDAGEGAKGFCHPLLHIVGAAAGREYGSVGEAYKHGETFCRSGYHHGVLEGLFGEDGDKLLTELDSLCAAIEGKERYSYNYFSCVHGIGHGLMAYFDHDLFASIAACDRLSGAWEESSCHGGVFMENVISNTLEEPSKFLKDDDPLYPCNAVAETYRAQCYLMQTSHMLVIFEGDFEKTFAACRTAGVHQKTCFQSIGRDASGWSYGNPESTISLCAAGTTLEERSACLTGAAADYIQSYGEARARSLCALGEDGARIPCIQTVEWHVKTL
ncbi:MAG: hypothetical protein AAB734_03105 [Patescibacteria group bacterium]